MSRDDPKLNIRLPQDMKEKIQLMAEWNKRSVNSEVVSILEEAVKGFEIEHKRRVAFMDGMLEHREKGYQERRIEISESAAREFLRLLKQQGIT